MTTHEWSLVKRLIILVVVAALFPVGALGYRVVFEPETASSGLPPAPTALYTLVPGSAAELNVATPTPTAIIVVVPNGWNEYTVPDSYFTVAVPARWQKLPVSGPELDASLQVIRQSNPELALALGTRGQELMAAGVKFWAFDFDPGGIQGKFATNLTVTRQLLPNSISFDTYVQVNLAQIQQLATRQGPVNHQRVLLGNLQAEKLNYALAFQSSDGSSVTSAITQYLVLKGNNAYVLTYATRADQADGYVSVFEASASSFRLLIP